ncbi:MAG: sigma-54 dependent transcriptional regulator [Proteobacteria bacterium]|nr:sigma-54 dependent transcriptional regulator [Pseudomonadota bacterium]MBU2226389.1 sigma-54 dependent transcriptional regulator [Pseudomonadota bacterium]MBU2262816.1 sigma-54 dependent transcriptional regulator [Pseudomonadota bacterium]
MKAARILVVDDELNMRLVLKAMLKKEGYEVVTAADGLEALKILRDEKFAVVATDLKMPGLDGMGLLERIMIDDPSLPVIILTAYGTVANAVDALKKGAFDYLTKPFEQGELKTVVLKAVKTRLINDSDLSTATDADPHRIVGTSGRMADIHEIVRKVSPTTTTVLITGETGTGKELIARAIHRNSARSVQPFIKINCAAIAENLVESELFGYEKGAFTGAVTTKPGRFELAHQGTLFLDEVGEIPRDMQVKLLQAIQDQSFERVGGLKTISVDVRLIAATNKNLLQQVKEGKFREDLFYRMNVFPIHVPPLRERTEDILPLADFFLEKFNRKLGRAVAGIDAEVRDCFLAYHWPGNIRELEHLLERVVLMAEGPLITMKLVPEEVVAATGENRRASADLPEEAAGRDVLKSHMEGMERQIIARCLEECGGNVTRAAERLGLSRKGLQLKMIKHNLRKPRG